MIVDLLRNDMGRVADVGTVGVQRLFELERYETVWQLTSTITATVGDEVGLVEILGALFPCGSVTGAPKQRTMELIADLETSPRGVYCGAIGYLAPASASGPSACFSVAIRTVTVDRDEGVAEFGVGGAITWDSSAVGEYDEARAKAQVLVDRRPDFDLLETIRFERGEGFWWLKEHLERLEASARYFGFAYDESAVRDALEQAADAAPAGPSRVRLTMSRSGGCGATAEGLTTQPDGLVVALDDEPVSSQNVFLFHKTTYRREYDHRRKRHPEADDVILVNERGEITETTIANLAVLLDGVWVTPPLESGCLPGVYRQVLLEAGKIFEGVVMVGDLARAEGLAVFNSVRLWREARLRGLTERGAPQTVG